MGFEVNPYDPCVAKKMINGSQMLVTWHVDDLKVSHKESTEVTTFTRCWETNNSHGLSVTRENIHSYVGTDGF